MKLVPLEEQERAIVGAMLTERAAVEQQLIGALRLIVRQKGLDGEWGLSADGRALVAREENPARSAAAQTPETPVA